MPRPMHVTFICTGNICRSPIAEAIFAAQIAERGLADAVRVSSAGTLAWYPAVDGRTYRVLRSHGYSPPSRVSPLTRHHLTADLLVAMGRDHADQLIDYGAPRDKVRLLRSFDPSAADPAPDVADPYYGTMRDFETAYAVIDAALPGLHAWVAQQLGDHATTGPIVRSLFTQSFTAVVTVPRSAKSTDL
jgi:protein-tyrosine phosphatase